MNRNLATWETRLPISRPDLKNYVPFWRTPSLRAEETDASKAARVFHKKALPIIDAHGNLFCVRCVLASTFHPLLTARIYRRFPIPPPMMMIFFLYWSISKTLNATSNSTWLPRSLILFLYLRVHRRPQSYLHLYFVSYSTMAEGLGWGG